MGAALEQRIVGMWSYRSRLKKRPFDLPPPNYSPHLTITLTLYHPAHSSVLFMEDFVPLEMKLEPTHPEEGLQLEI
uniref:Uncharacterized protein n=1 Tax=Pyxicephalus adspersus TaxID=30357 RepID=A0AAV2ZQI6_PYXAD|nr:TPA: hypothetical protein GDO54_014747 [Pyxicephalus adspersus]